MSRPLVTVVVPTRDRPVLLERALRSVREQTYDGPIECLVVFDQTEPVEPQVQLRENFTIRTIVNERTPGLAGARNTGILAANGEIVGFLDDDDEWLPEKLDLQVDLLERTRAGIVSSGIYIRYGKHEFQRLPPHERVTFQDLLRSRCADINPCNLLVERERLLDTIGLVDEQLPGSYAEDYDFLLRATRAGDIAAVQRPLVRIHWHKGSFFATRWEMIINALGYLLEKFPEFAEEPRGLSRVYGQLAFANAATGRRAEARKYARQSLRLNAMQPRAYLALLVDIGLVRPDAVLRLAHTFGRGI